MATMVYVLIGIGINRARPTVSLKGNAGLQMILFIKKMNRILTAVLIVIAFAAHGEPPAVGNRTVAPTVPRATSAPQPQVAAAAATSVSPKSAAAARAEAKAVEEADKLEALMSKDPKYDSRSQFEEMNSLGDGEKYEAATFDLGAITASEDGNAQVSNEVPTDEPPKVELIVDSSGSMGQLLNGPRTKMYYSKKLLNRYLIDQWKQKSDLGLRVYGSKRRNDCQDNFLAIKHGAYNLGDVESFVKKTFPIGKTPLNQSIQDAIDGIKSHKGPKRIVIFTDGEETCGGDPCELSARIKRQTTLDIQLFVVAIGFAKGSSRYKQVACLGDTNVANNEEELFGALGDMSNKINTQNNLIVKSPDPKSIVSLYRIENGERKLVRTFTAAWGVKVPPGKYEAIVDLNPPYRFKPFEIPPKKRVYLVVAGKGKVFVKFRDSLLNVELLDNNNRVMHKFKTDQPYRATMGKYNMRVYQAPFYENVFKNFLVAPEGDHSLEIGDAGVVRIDHPELLGYYVYNNSDALIGNFLTNFPLILKNQIYRLHLNEKCFFENVSIQGPRDITLLSCKNK